MPAPSSWGVMSPKYQASISIAKRTSDTVMRIVSARTSLRESSAPARERWKSPTPRLVITAARQRKTRSQMSARMMSAQCSASAATGHSPWHA